MLVEAAIGDAYGGGFEYVDRKFVEKYNDLSRYVKHPWHKLQPGCYTDDTQMSIAIAELIIEEEEWTREIIASRFLDAFHRDQRGGYAKGFFAFLKKTKTGAEFLENIRPNSDKSGAAMRACPIGVLPDVTEVINRCRMQASLTHDTPDGINAAVAAALMTHYFIYDLGEKSDLPDFLCQHVPGNWSERWSGKVGSKGWMSVRAAITSLLRNECMSSLLKSCIAWTGDTDTVATIALAAGSCCREIEQDLPDILYKELENGPYGRDFLMELDMKLKNRD